MKFEGVDFDSLDIILQTKRLYEKVSIWEANNMEGIGGLG
jgi:hypothetical protein